MSERISTTEVAYDLKKGMIGLSSLTTILAWLPPDKILIGRGNQRWLITIQEIPCEYDNHLLS